MSKLRIDDIFKINDRHIMLGTDVVDDLIISPNVALRDRVLGDQDFINKQTNIIKFKDKYTREAKSSESNAWFYCNKTGVKLLPEHSMTRSTPYLAHGISLGLENCENEIGFPLKLIEPSPRTKASSVNGP